MRMKNFIFMITTVLFIILAALLPIAAMAAEFRIDKSGSISINDAVKDDLYSAGNNVSLNGPVSGDAVVAGSNVSISGSVGKSVLAAGGMLNVLGNVSYDVRIIGGNILINGNVGHDVVVLGGQINISSSASVGGDVVVLGGTVTVDGPVKGNVYVRAGDVTINAHIGGSVMATARTLVIGSQAMIGSRLVYSSPSPAQIAGGVVNGTVEYNKTATNNSGSVQNAFAAFFTIALLIKLISLFVLALIFTAVFKRRTSAVVTNAFDRFGWDILHGFSALVLIPFAALILFATIIGAPLAIFAIAAYGILLVLAGVLAPILVGAWIWKLAKKAPEYPVNNYSIAVGVIIYGLASLVPLVGLIFDLVFMLVALGALTRATLAGIVAEQGGLKRAQ
jgi:hypothetical protein